MRKVVKFIGLILLVLILCYCSPNKNETAYGSPNYNLKSHTLIVDYSNNPDTSLLQIIAISKIRKSGYGILLNLDNSYSNSDLDTLKRKFQKLDINAIHSFNISVKDSLQPKIQVAIEGAQFIWILDNKNTNWETEPLGHAISVIQEPTKDNGLVVLSKN